MEMAVAEVLLEVALPGRALAEEAPARWILRVRPPGSGSDT